MGDLEFKSEDFGLSVDLSVFFPNQPFLGIIKMLGEGWYLDIEFAGRLCVIAQKRADRFNF